MFFEIIRYYNSEEDFKKFYEKLKQILCPGCKQPCTLILYGFIYGFDEKGDNKQKVRGRKVFCNSRKKRNKGCGRIFRVLASNIIKNYIITAKSLWCFLNNSVKLPSKIEAFRNLEFPLHDSSTYRLWKKFKNSQSKIRTYLNNLLPAPDLPGVTNPMIQTINHLKLVFNNSTCPIAEFQNKFQTSFI